MLALRVYGAILVCLVIGLGVPASATDQILRMDSRPAAGFYWPYFLLIPTQAQLNLGTQNTTHILVLPNNTGHPDDDASIHETTARKDVEISRAANIARDLGLILLVPAFPRPESHPEVYTHALGRGCFTTSIRELSRLDLQLLAMLQDAHSRLTLEGWDLSDKILMTGFSASVGFSNRFTALHPKEVLAVAGGGLGGWPIAPISSWCGTALPYPFGISDLQELTGESFDFQDYSQVQQCLFLGSQDTNDAWGGSWLKWFRTLVGETPVDRWPIAQEIYRGAGLPVSFHLIQGLGHSENLETEALEREFFRDVLADHGFMPPVSSVIVDGGISDWKGVATWAEAPQPLDLVARYVLARPVLLLCFSGNTLFKLADGQYVEISFRTLGGRSKYCQRYSWILRVTSHDVTLTRKDLSTKEETPLNKPHFAFGDGLEIAIPFATVEGLERCGIAQVSLRLRSPTGGVLCSWSASPIKL